MCPEGSGSVAIQDGSPCFTRLLMRRHLAWRWCRAPWRGSQLSMSVYSTRSDPNLCALCQSLIFAATGKRPAETLRCVGGVPSSLPRRDHEASSNAERPRVSAKTTINRAGQVSMVEQAKGEAQVQSGPRHVAFRAPRSHSAWRAEHRRQNAFAHGAVDIRLWRTRSPNRYSSLLLETPSVLSLRACKASFRI